jgi:hypothetical protein
MLTRHQVSSCSSSRTGGETLPAGSGALVGRLFAAPVASPRVRETRAGDRLRFSTNMFELLTQRSMAARLNDRG